MISHIEKINKIKVVSTPRPPVDESKIAAFDMFQRVSCNIAIIGSTTSGKTTVLLNIIKKAVSKKTNVIVFASCHNVDETYLEIGEFLEKKKCKVSMFTDIYEDNEDDHGNVVGKPFNMLNKIRKELEDGMSEDEAPHPPEPLMGKVRFGIQPEPVRPPPLSQEEKEKLKEKKPKGKQYCELFMALDDLGDLLRDRSLFKWLKESRQFKAKTVLLMHSPINLEPQSISQLQYILIFDGFSDEAIEVLYQKIGFKIDFPSFLQAYKFATTIKYDFFYIDRVANQLRRNFSDLLQFKAPDPIVIKNAASNG